MTELSPSAQLVHSACANAYWNSGGLDPEGQAAVAVLRAIAEYSCEEQDEPPATPYEQGYLDAVEWVFKRINAIADELEVKNV
jgi:hypothetical protein